MAAYSSAEASRLAGVSYRQLDYWADRGFVRPTKAARGRGSARRWGALEVLLLRVARELREADMSLPRVRRATAWLAKALPKVGAAVSGLAFVTDGRQVFYLSPHPGAFVNVLAAGHPVLVVTIDEMLREVGVELSPNRENTAAAQYDLPETVRLGESGQFIACCPALRGCVAQGRTRQEAQSNLRAALASYIDLLEEAAAEGGERRLRCASAGRR
jgi:predicted RNase H-like HicB family nuclease